MILNSHYFFNAIHNDRGYPVQRTAGSQNLNASAFGSNNRNSSSPYLYSRGNAGNQFGIGTSATANPFSGAQTAFGDTFTSPARPGFSGATTSTFRAGDFSSPQVGLGIATSFSTATAYNPAIVS